MSLFAMRHIRLMLPCPPPTSERAWGDYYFARSLAEALNRLGVWTQLHFAAHKAPARMRNRIRLRQLFTRPGGVDLVIRGRVPYAPARRRPLFMWLISSPDNVTDEELAGVEHIFVASRSFCKSLQERGYSASFLPQCTDPRLFNEDRKDPALHSEVLFVGNRRDYAPREVVEEIAEAGLPLAVWGRGWQACLPDTVYRGLHIPNDELGQYYASANVVLNDHTSDMYNEGFVSNRVFDVLASGSKLVTEEMADLPEIAVPHIFAYEQGGALDAVRRALAAPAEKMPGLAAQIRQDWSFDARAETLVSDIFGARAPRRITQGTVGPSGRASPTTKEI